MMFKRVFKLILVGTLIFGITVPSNAAVSVSDGSAFVTKAEFSADLNNLSNRMAQLENSLDAKIDSLVSSYLTRNGIWNGAKQEQKFNFVWTRESTEVMPSGYTSMEPTKTFTCTFRSSTGVRSYLYDYNMKIVSKMSKSGLIAIDYISNPITDYLNVSGALAKPTWSIVNTSSSTAFNIYISQQTGSGYIEFYTYKEGKDDANFSPTSDDAVLSYAINYLAHKTDAGTKSFESIFYPLITSGTAQFFVSKDDSLWIRDYCFLIPFGDNANNNINNLRLSSSSSINGSITVIKSINIY